MISHWLFIPTNICNKASHSTHARTARFNADLTLHKEPPAIQTPHAQFLLARYLRTSAAGILHVQLLGYGSKVRSMTTATCARGSNLQRSENTKWMYTMYSIRASSFCSCSIPKPLFELAGSYVAEPAMRQSQVNNHAGTSTIT